MVIQPLLSGKYDWERAKMRTPGFLMQQHYGPDRRTERARLGMKAAVAAQNATRAAKT
jgi:hypothetical protein